MSDTDPINPADHPEVFQTETVEQGDLAGWSYALIIATLALVGIVILVLA